MEYKINEKVMKDIVLLKVKDIKHCNRKINGCIDDEDIDDILKILIKEEIGVEDAIYKHLNTSNRWVSFLDDSEAYVEFGRINRGVFAQSTEKKQSVDANVVKRSDFTYYVKKDIEMFFNFLITCKTDKYNNKFLELMDEIVNNEPDIKYENIAYRQLKGSSIFR